MFSPQCKAEYRPGFTHCSDCDVALVEEPPKSYPSPISLSETEMKCVWFCDDQGSCESVCSRLEEAIPCKVTQRKRQVFWRLDEHFEVWVPTEFYDKAKPIAEKGCSDFSECSVMGEWLLA